MFLFFFFFCVPQLSYHWGSPYWVRFLHMWPFSNPTIEVVPFGLHGWYMLGMFLLPAFTRLGHECQDFFVSVRWNACVHTPHLSLYSHLKEFWGNGVRTHVNSKGTIPSTRKNLLKGGSDLWCCIKHDSKPNTTNELFRQKHGSSAVFWQCESQEQLFCHL